MLSAVFSNTNNMIDFTSLEGINYSFAEVQGVQITPLYLFMTMTKNYTNENILI